MTLSLILFVGIPGVILLTFNIITKPRDEKAIDRRGLISGYIGAIVFSLLFITGVIE